MAEILRFSPHRGRAEMLDHGRRVPARGGDRRARPDRHDRDHDAGAFSPYSPAGQEDYSYSLLWALSLMSPVPYVYQEMVIRLGLWPAPGHARLILELSLTGSTIRLLRPASAILAQAGRA
jgi:hypothetical protein